MIQWKILLIVTVVTSLTLLFAVNEMTYDLWDDYGSNGWLASLAIVSVFVIDGLLLVSNRKTRYVSLPDGESRDSLQSGRTIGATTNPSSFPDDPYSETEP